MIINLQNTQTMTMDDQSSMAVPCRIDFGAECENNERENLPVYLRIKPIQEEELSIKIINDTIVETNHGKLCHIFSVYFIHILSNYDDDYYYY